MNFMVFNNPTKLIVKGFIFDNLSNYFTENVSVASYTRIYYLDIFHCVFFLSFFLFVKQIYLFEINLPAES